MVNFSECHLSGNYAYKMINTAARNYLPGIQMADIIIIIIRFLVNNVMEWSGY